MTKRKQNNLNENNCEKFKKNSVDILIIQTYLNKLYNKKKNLFFLGFSKMRKKIIFFIVEVFDVKLERSSKFSKTLIWNEYTNCKKEQTLTPMFLVDH